MRCSSDWVFIGCLFAGAAARSGAAPPVDRLRVLSPEWVVLANDYTAARGFYRQRCGCALSRPWTAWERGRCHPPPVGSCRLPGNGGPIWYDASGRHLDWAGDLDFAVVKATAEPGVALDIWGGWHDAAPIRRRAGSGSCGSSSGRSRFPAPT